MKKSIFIILLVILSLVGAFLFLEKVPLNVYPGDIMFLPVLIASSLVDSINPCAFSVLLISIAFLASLGASRKKMIVLGLSYIFGIFAVYLFIGLGLLRVLDFFGIPNFMGKVGATILLLFGLSNVLSYIFPNFPIEFKIPKSAHSKMAVFMGKASFVGSFILGALVALFEFPCTGGPYLLILGLLHDGGGAYIKGLGYLLIYNLIFVSPLVFLLIAASNKELTAKMEGLKKKAAGAGKMWGGLAMIILAFVIFFFS
jgi:cytochrome c biogenesis protein CcdA